MRLRRLFDRAYSRNACTIEAVMTDDANRPPEEAVDKPAGDWGFVCRTFAPAPRDDLRVAFIPVPEKNVMTLAQLFLIHRYKVDSIHYLTPSDDNHRQAERMLERGLFSAVTDEVGQIIVAEVAKPRIKELLEADRKALGKLIAE